jgi:hypothetical protein
MSRLTVHALAALSIIIGVGSLIVFTIFLYTGPFYSTNLGLGLAEALVLDASLCLVFFFQHSAYGAKNRTSRMILLSNNITDNLFVQ